MTMKRLFIGTFIKSDKFFEGYKRILNEFSPIIFGKWVELENLHFTYKFLGDVDEEKIPDIINSLDGLLEQFDSSYKLKGLGTFPNLKNPRIFYVNIINSDMKIFDIFKSIEEEMSRLGYEKEKRGFTPHLTLLRIKSVTNKFNEVLAKYSNSEFAMIDKFSVNLIESQLTPKGPIYTIMK